MSKFELSYPIKPHILTQPFGVDKATYSQFKLQGHNGLDILANHGEPIYAAHDGIAFYEEDGKQGHGVVLISDKPYEYKEGLAFFKTIYWHMCDPKESRYASPIWKVVGINSGKSVSVKEGDILGYADNTGFSNGTHLHFGLKPIGAGKPPKEGDAPDLNIGNWRNLEQNNGFLGSIDPAPYFNGFAAQDINLVKKAFEVLIALLTKKLQELKDKKKNG